MKGQESTSILKGKTITWTWTKGTFKDGKYEISLLTNGHIHWKGLEGAEKGQEVIDKEYCVLEVNEDVCTLSWLESIGWTVTVTLNLKENRVYGFVSNDREWHPLIGVIDSIQ
ncbi:phenolic acid decarboxylase [uncultured Psychroserpens sp.]|uniref:phenolic acid decarboxylase n=1 Tax=uncultured Psychroserpens sp. TaxID=255436 RepID=UPI00261ADE8A|nr:phenolic acid decarboxylase [uncultured Psychroserpens sp.]